MLMLYWVLATFLPFPSSMSLPCLDIQRAQAWPGGSEGGDPERDAGRVPPALQAHTRMVVVCSLRDESTCAALRGAGPS